MMANSVKFFIFSQFCLSLFSSFVAVLVLRLKQTVLLPCDKNVFYAFHSNLSLEKIMNHSLKGLVINNS